MVNECPKFLSLKPSLSDHSIYFPEEDLRFALLLTSTTSYLPTRCPSKEELNSLPVLELTPQCDFWNPHSNIFQDQEDAMVDYKGEIREDYKPNHLVFASSTSSSATPMPPRLLSSVAERSSDSVLLADDLLARGLSSNLSYEPEKNEEHHAISCIRHDRSSFISVVKASGHKSDITAARLAKVFNINESLAVRTLQNVTRLCPRNTSDITLHRRYPPNDRMLRYSRMLTDLFMDTMFAKSPKGKSARGYTCCQVFATEFG